MPRRVERPYRVAFLGSMALVTALLIFMYGVTVQTESELTLLSAVLFLVAGVAMAFVMVGVRFEPFEFRDLLESILWTALSFGAIYMVNRVVPFTLQVQVLTPKVFSVLMGVAEEAFFRLWFTTFIHRATNSTFLAMVVSSVTWSVYHIGRYQGQPNAFWIIFLSGLVLAFVMLKSKMADGVIFAHALVNFMAT